MKIFKKPQYPRCRVRYDWDKWPVLPNATILACDRDFVKILIDGKEDPETVGWHCIKFRDRLEYEK